MSSIGSWLMKKEPLLPGEEVVWEKLANRTQSSKRAVGGKLFLTNQRLVFCPHLFDALFKGEPWSVRLEEIKGFNTQERGGDTFGGGLRKRLSVELIDGASELFVINGLDEVIPRLEQALQGTIVTSEDG